MGWDAFGLPAENAAKERGVPPSKWTMDNIESMRKQFTKMGTYFDWSREITTCDPSYHKWTQQLFLMMYRRGLAYRKEATVNWDPVDLTVLANEQVDANGRAERSGALVEKKRLKQWHFRITEYANDLLDTLESLQWPSTVKQLQINWIGRSEGYSLRLGVYRQDEPADRITTIVVDGDSARTAFYASHIAVGPDHPLIDEKFLPKATSAAVFDMTNAEVHPEKIQGIFTALYATNPITSTKLPIFLTLDAESGQHWARFGSPRTSERDRQFVSVQGIRWDDTDADESMVKRWAEAAEKSGVGSPKRHYARIRDWLISRQRRWGTPIPIVHCDTCGPTPVPENELPVILPYDPSAPTERSCPKCGHDGAHIETDTMDTFVDSSWYWLRYCDPQNTQSMCDTEKANALLPVDVYIGGAEHSIMHLLYARFIAKVLTEEGIVDLPNGEPFTRLLTQGMVQAKTYRDPESGRPLRKSEVNLTDPEKPIVKATSAVAHVSWEKMSKSKYNGVDPEEVLDKHGVDATRLYILYKAPPADELVWDDSAIVGMERWLARVWGLVVEVGKGRGKKDPDLEYWLHFTIKEVTECLTKSFHFNVAIAHFIKLTHRLSEADARSKCYDVAKRDLVRMIAPFAPCAAEEFWRDLGMRESVFEGGWPEYEVAKLRRETVVCAVMVNGKTRGVIDIPVSVGTDAEELERLARDSNIGKEWLVGADGNAVKAKRVIVAKNGRMISFVV